MRIMRSFLLAAFLLVLFAATSFTADYRDVQIDLDANVSRGQLVYRKSCRKVCHDGTAGTGKAISPKEFSMAEWEKFAKNIAKLPCIDEWRKGLSEDDLSDIFSYLYSGASDSPTPVT